ncbi:hypothetical protein [Rhodococcus sp. IEGM 1374]|uniref:hypothetical protein n=1 Tax=Rhodococcus sp. IEGM 1374 TaxID=3082221 RepID=UPI002954634E|nr:hypothetical protein [Rhodococcus sp. IEGM 1374]MDV7992084.1 hypothetical protein [Rhodococcus sp. IEGM 1374]
MHWLRWSRHGAIGDERQRRFNHRLSEDPVYRIWAAMRARCTNSNHPSFKDYGARGIKVCDRWDDFRNFKLDMGERPDGFSIERKNFNGNYEPSNCVWASNMVQSLNKRFPPNRTGFRGVTQHVNRWGAKISLNHVKFNIGEFASPEEAAWMFDQWALVIHGELAQTNFEYVEVQP